MNTNNPTTAVTDMDTPNQHHRTIKSFVRRAGRITTGQTQAFTDWGAQFLLPFTPNTLLSTEFLTQAPKIIFEIGFGMGEATAHIAKVLSDAHLLACEVHQPGVGALLKRIGEQDINNITIVSHDAVEVIDQMLPLMSLDGVHIFFPDPWHKKRHNKRRLIQPDLIKKLTQRLKVGGYIHCATDWEPYAVQMLEVLSGELFLKNRGNDTPASTACSNGYSTKPHYRPLTKFENRGIRLGHGVWDLVFERVA